MSFLFPLYLLGIATVAIPVILHLRRRPPVERTEFSSLMFLEASPMERKRRRRLENLLILLLRCALICLLAFLFARPLFRGEATAGAEGDGRLVVILLDRSASMQRENLWEEAVGKARSAASKTGAGDRLALLAFDGNPELLVGFDSAGEGDRSGDLVAGQLEGLEPGWGSTDLGTAIAFAVELIEEARSAAQTGGAGPDPGAPAEILLISDLQEGAERGALDTVGWPGNTTLVVEALAPRQAGNASLHLLASTNILTLRGEGAATGGGGDRGERGALRLRLANEATSIADEFRIGWADRSEDAREHILAPGAQRTFPMAIPAGGAVLELEGDEHDFDNRVHVVPEEPRPLRVFYLGGDGGEAGDTANPFFYLKRAVQATNFHAPVMHREIPDGLTLPEVADFVIVAGPVEESVAGDIGRYLEGGGTALAVITSASQGEQLGVLMGDEGFALEEADPESEYVLLEEIQFDNALLGAFENPRVRDFSKVHFWHYRKPKGEQTWHDDAVVLARFDSGEAAWLSLAVGDGQLVVFTSGWQPEDSQLGLSTKFVPLIYSLLESGAGAVGGAQFVVGDGLPVAANSMVRRPDGVEERAGGSGFYSGTDVPGIYRVAGEDGEHSYAVNLDHRESRTESIPLERLEEAGIVIAGRAEAEAGGELPAADPVRRRYMLDAEREKRQQLWRWLIFGAILVVFLEMILAGRKAQPGVPEAV